MADVLTRDDVGAVLPADEDVEVAPARMGRLDYKWVALGVVLLGTIMTILDATIVNIAIPTLQVDLKAGSYNDIAWVVTGYMLAQGAVIPMTGWATDRFGTKRLYLLTITLFTLASMACGLAQNLGELILFRVLQGIGGGMLMPVGMTIIMKAVGPQNMGRMMGAFGVPMLLAPALGPVLGGWFVQDFTWRLIFYVNVPIGIVAFIAASRFLVESHRTHGLRLDMFGLLTATPAVVSVMYAVDQSTSLGWTSSLVITLLILAAVLMTSFVLSQLDHRTLATRLMLPLFALAGTMAIRAGVTDGWTHITALVMYGAAGLAVVNVAVSLRGAAEPLLHLPLFKDRTFSWAMVLSFLIVTALFGAMLLLPIYLQQIRGYNALETGLMLLPQAATAAVVMPIGGALSDRLGPRPVVLFGLVMLGIGGVLLAQLHTDSPLILVVMALALRGVAMGFCMMPSMAAALATVPPQFTSRASSITNSLQRVSSSVGIAILVTVLAAQVGTAAHQTPCSPSPAVVAAASSVLHQPVTAQQICSRLISTTSGTSLRGGTAGASRTSGNPVYDSFVRSYVDDTLSTSFDRAFAFIAIITLIGIVPALFLRRPASTQRRAAFAA
jgi:MFS family permease